MTRPGADAVGAKHESPGCDSLQAALSLSTPGGTTMDFAERAARNEEVFRGVNDRIEQSERATRRRDTDALPLRM
jgi:hypothetical protein